MHGRRSVGHGRGGVCRGRSARVAAVATMTGSLVVALGAVAASAPAAGAAGKKSPVVIGTSLSLSGDFSADGQAFERGYELWQHDVNAHGGLLGHPVKLKILSDGSSTNQVVTNYTTLISTDHAKLVFGPFSSLLTVPASKVAHRYGYAFVEGAGGAPSVFANKLPNLFDVSYPVATGLVPFAKWIASMPKTKRPATAAYATITTIFESGQFPLAQKILEKAGVKTVYTNKFPTETTDYTPIASAAAASKATIFLLGCTDVPTVSSFIQSFQQAHYEPKAFIATAGPDQGAAYVSAVGATNATGTMVEGGWNGTFTNAESKKMVDEYTKKYGGSPADVNADVAEAYGVGQVVQQAVSKVKSFTNAKLIQYLHGNHTFQTVQGPVKFNKLGENVKGVVFEFQWQTGGTKFNQVLPKGAPGTLGSPTFPKPAFGG